MAQAPEKITLKSFLNPITMITALIFLIGFILIGLAVLFLGRNQTPGVNASPVVTKIAAPTQTSTIPNPTGTPSPTPTPIFLFPDGVIGIGAYVQVGGTGGAGLRMREAPGLGGAIIFTALDAEVFLIIDGPVEADGYIWWHLEAPYDQTRNGWSAGDFLTLIEEEE